MVADISAFTYFTPIFVFVLVFVVMYAILKKTPLLGEIKGINVIVSLIIAVIFASVSSAREYIQTVAPYFVILVVALFFLLFLISFAQGDISKMKWIAVVFIILIALVFILSAVKVFNLTPYIPGASESGGNPTILDIKHFVLEDKVLGAILLIIVAIIVVWVVVKR